MNVINKKTKQVYSIIGEAMNGSVSGEVVVVYKNVDKSSECFGILFVCNRVEFWKKFENDSVCSCDICN